MSELQHTIDGFIRCNIAGVRNAIEQILLVSSDPNVNTDTYVLINNVASNGDVIGVKDGDGYVKFYIDFEVESERDSILASLHAVNGLFIKCEEGSYYRSILDDNQLVLKNRTGSVVLQQWRKNGS